MNLTSNLNYFSGLHFDKMPFDQSNEIDEAEEGIPYPKHSRTNLTPNAERIHFQNVITTFSHYTQYSVRHIRRRKEDEEV